ncbi:MAG: hypothetical protein R3A80_05820 [Bdellovibrionota bacterium]
MRPWTALFLIPFSITLNAASSKIPDKNPFRNPALSSLGASTKASQVKIVFSGNVTGMRESCGCALNPKGGLERRYNYLKNEGLLSAERDNALLLDFGNLLFKTPAYEKGGDKESFANAEAMVEGTNFFNMTAVNLGIMDRTLAPEKLSQLWAKSKFSWLASNIIPPGRFAASFRRRVPVNLRSGKVVLFGLSSFDDKLKEYGWTFEKPEEALKKELADLPADVFPIVLSDVEMSELLPLAKTVKRPVLFLGARESGGWDRPIEVGGALLVHLRQQGQDWGVFKFSLPTKAKSGWYNPSDSEDLARRWDDLVTEAHTVRGLASSNQRNVEVEKIEAQIKEMLTIAPQPNDIAFAFETIEMNAAFDGENVVSKFMK